MEIKPLRLIGTFEILLEPRRDERGYFLRVYDEVEFAASGLTTASAQENQAFSLRKGSCGACTFRNHFATKLWCGGGQHCGCFSGSAAGGGHLRPVGHGRAERGAAQGGIHPKGFAHGYCTLRDASLVLYKVDCRYTPEAEGGIRWNDPDLGIPWPADDPLVSGKDAKLPLFRDFVTPFA